MENWGWIERQQRDYLITPQIEIPLSAQAPSIEFDVYYRALYWEDLRDTIKSYGYLYGDTLAVSISDDCGQTWQRLYYKGGEELDVTGRAISVVNQDLQTAQHAAVPPAGVNTAWRHETIRIPNRYKGRKVLIRFENISEMGNNLYIDSVQVREASTAHLGVGSSVSVSLYPNPATDDVYLSIRGAEKQPIRYRLLSAHGVELEKGTLVAQDEHVQHRFSMGSLAAGLYLLHLDIAGITYSWRLIRE
ncbi:MAG: hypothetical protein RML92_08880 [Bacteroidia bacterium]|nr:hypothetical protein [Bacteroidia bacterium]